MAKKKEEPRPVVYPTRTVELWLAGSEYGPLTCEKAKELLGWEEAEGKDYALVDEEQKRIVCKHNSRNRPFDEKHSRSLALDILKRNWADSRMSAVDGEDPPTDNGESIVISTTGVVLSGQHRLIGLVLAAQKWANEEKWAEFWDEEPSIEVTIQYGVSENKRVLRTLDNVKPRQLSDVLYTSGLLGELGSSTARSKVEKLSRFADNAVRLLWDRTGAKAHPYTPYQTHSESLDFIERHPRLIRAIKHIYAVETEGEGKGVSTWIMPGTATGLMYLMAASMSDGPTYWGSEKPSEELLDFKAKVPSGVKDAPDMEVWEKAAQFWQDLVTPNNKTMEALRRTLGQMVDEAQLEGLKVSPREKVTAVAKAWNLYVAGKKLKEDDVMPLYEKDEEGKRRLAEAPLVGGIDRPKDEESVGDEGSADGNPTPEEVEAEKARIDAEKLEKRKARQKEEPASEEKPAAPKPTPKNQANGAPPSPKPASPKPKPKQLAGGTGPAAR